MNKIVNINKAEIGTVLNVQVFLYRVLNNKSLQVFLKLHKRSVITLIWLLI